MSFSDLTTARRHINKKFFNENLFHSALTYIYMINIYTSAFIYLFLA